MTEKLRSTISYIVLMIITVIAGSYAIGFLVQKSATCDTNHIQFCNTESACSRETENVLGICNNCLDENDEETNDIKGKEIYD